MLGIIKEVIYLKFRRVLPISQSDSTCIKTCLITVSCSRSYVATYCVKSQSRRCSSSAQSCPVQPSRAEDQGPLLSAHGVPACGRGVMAGVAASRAGGRCQLAPTVPAGVNLHVFAFILDKSPLSQHCLWLRDRCVICNSACHGCVL